MWGGKEPYWVSSELSVKGDQEMVGGGALNFAE
jgi:hypothetical protein